MQSVAEVVGAGGGSSRLFSADRVINLTSDIGERIWRRRALAGRSFLTWRKPPHLSGPQWLLLSSS